MGQYTWNGRKVKLGEKMTPFKVNNERLELIYKEIENILNDNSHLTLKNFLHQRTLAKKIWSYTEKKIREVLVEVESGYCFRLPEHKEKTDLTPRQLKKKNTSVQVAATGGGIIEAGKKED